jgi:hypothetical protein
MALLVVGHWVNGSAPAGVDSDFCSRPVVRDFEKPFDRMPRVHEPPFSGELPFAPSRTYLHQPRSQVLVTDEYMQIGYAFGVDQGPDRTFALNWLVSGRLFKVNGRGESIKALTDKKWSIGTVSDEEFGDLAFRFGLPSGEGLYRVDLIFRKDNGRVIGRYGQYFRVVRPTVSVRLALSQQSARSGEAIFLRIENFGTTAVSYAEPFYVERFNGTGWVPYPLGYAWHRPIFRIRGGLAGKCQSFPIPSDMPSGLYRFRKPLASPGRALTASFEVLP